MTDNLLTDRKSAWWYATLFREALKEAPDVTSARLAADYAFQIHPLVPDDEWEQPEEQPLLTDDTGGWEAAFALDASRYYHGPNSPGPGWVQVGTGPDGGKIWGFQGRSAKPIEPPTPPVGRSQVDEAKAANAHRATDRGQIPTLQPVSEQPKPQAAQPKPQVQPAPKPQPKPQVQPKPTPAPKPQQQPAPTKTPPVKPPANQGQLLSKVSSQVRQRDLNDSMRELQGVNLKSNAPSIPKEVASQFDAHGTENLTSLAQLLNGGVDPKREFYSSPLSAAYDQEQYGTGVRDNSSFVVLSHPGQTIKQGGIPAVMVDPLHEESIPDLQQAFPGVKFFSVRKAGEVLPKVAGSNRGGIKYSLDVMLAHDIFNPRAQGILNRAIKAAGKLATTTRRELADALKLDDATIAAGRIIEIIAKHRVALANLLGATNLAAVLEGAQEIARKVPMVPIPGTAPPIPPTLTHEQALEIVSRLKKLPAMDQMAQITALSNEQQPYIRALLMQPEPPPVPMLFTPRKPPEGSLEHVQFPTIETAAEELRSKRLLDRPAYDRLDAAARQKAFTVAGVDAQETLGKIRDALAKNIEEGVDYKAFREKLLEEVSPDTFLSENHLEVVFRAGIQSAFSDGQMKVLAHPYIKSGFPYADVHVIHDDRVREEHLEVEKSGIDKTSTFRIDDPVFQTFRGPWDFGCRCGWTPKTVQHAAEGGLSEAKKWLETGVEPSPPAYVAWPPFRPPAGFQRSLDSAPLSIRLSMLAMEDVQLATDSWQPFKGPRGGQGWRNTSTQEVVYQEEKPGGGSPQKESGARRQRRGKLDDAYARHGKAGETKEDFAERVHLEGMSKQQVSPVPQQAPVQQQAAVPPKPIVISPENVPPLLQEVIEQSAEPIPSTARYQLSPSEMKSFEMLDKASKKTGSLNRNAENKNWVHGTTEHDDVFRTESGSDYANTDAPRPTTKATPEQIGKVKDSVKSIFGSMGWKEGDAPVLVADLRNRVLAPDSGAFDKALKELALEKILRIIAIGDLSEFTKRGLMDSIPGESQTFGYVEPRVPITSKLSLEDKDQVATEELMLDFAGDVGGSPGSGPLETQSAAPITVKAKRKGGKPRRTRKPVKRKKKHA